MSIAEFIAVWSNVIITVGVLLVITGVSVCLYVFVTTDFDDYDHHND